MKKKKTDDGAILPNQAEIQANSVEEVNKNKEKKVKTNPTPTSLNFDNLDDSTSRNQLNKPELIAQLLEAKVFYKETKALVKITKQKLKKAIKKENQEQIIIETFNLKEAKTHKKSQKAMVRNLKSLKNGYKKGDKLVEVSGKS